MKLRTLAIALACLAALCFVSYAPSLSIPLLEDDYPNIAQAQTYGAVSGLHTLFGDATFRLRATSYWTMCLLWQAFHLLPLGYHLASLALHIANTWLVYFLCGAWFRMRPAAFWAAAFFAVYEGHQEAIMWFSAVNELLMVLFGLGALLCWTLAFSRERNWMLRLCGIVLFALALISKESAVIFLPLFLLTIPVTNWRRTIVPLLPYCLPAGLALASIAAARHSSFRFSDGSFSLSAPFWITWPRGFARILWIWGWLSAAVAVFVAGREAKVSGLLAAVWIGITLVPYSFLTYSTQIPSRQTYLASIGLSFLFGLAIAHLSSRKLAIALVAVMAVHNVGYLWTKKRAQFLQRAEPTEQLIQLARQTPGPIWVRCFPRPALIAQEAVHLAAGWQPSNLIWSESEAARRKPAAVFCYRER